MTKSKAIEILNQRYDEYVFIQRLRFSDESDVIDRMIALLTAIDALEQDSSVKAEPDNGWISVKDRLPDDKKRYLICGLHGRIDIAYYQPMGDKFSNHEPFWQGSTRRFTIVTHWRPLPDPPESEDDKE